jgi:crotonobetaine/carnitine-CoA ligase
VNKFTPISRSAVFPVPAEMGNEDEIAMVVQVVPDETTSAEEIRDFLLRSLPEFMVPTQIKIMDDLPTTETNKIQKSQVRNALMEGLDRGGS